MSVLKIQLFALFFITTSLSNIHAQDIEIEISENFKARSKYSYVNFIYGDENNFYFYSYKGVTLFRNGATYY